MISHLGRYEVVSELGRGAMGVVYKAHDPLIERNVAVKTIDLAPLSPEDRKQYAARFYQEAKAAGHLNHPNIVTIHDLGETGDIAYIAMEVMEGRELQHILDGPRRLSIEDVLDIAIQAASGMAYAHQRGIIHRDIKPSNIMVLGNNHVKIVDFGIAKRPTSLALTRSGLVMGSPLYMSPEQVEAKKIDARSDIFSLGVVLYQMLTWQLPFAGSDFMSVAYNIVNTAPECPAALNPQVGEMLDGVVMRCLQKDPEARYANADDLAKDLQLCRDELVRVKMGLAEPESDRARFLRFKDLVTPGALSQNKVLTVSYVVMILIFVLDMLTDVRNATIQMHLLYLFPLAMVGLHCERLSAVRLSIAISLILQVIIVFVEPLPLYARIALMALFIPSDLFAAYMARTARANFLEVSKLSSFDGLTGLRNRLSFESIMEIELANLARKWQSTLSCAFVDLDNFKDFNDAQGYLAGDRALKLLADVLKENTRQSDTIGRIGGDEFAILMPGTSEAECESLCKQISEKVAARMAAASLPIATSIGHATFDHAPASISEIFLKAENAMHAVQAGGMRLVPHRILPEQD